MTQLGARKIKLNLMQSLSKMHQNQVGQNCISLRNRLKKGEARFTVCDIARKVGISLSSVNLISKKHFK